MKAAGAEAGADKQSPCEMAKATTPAATYRFGGHHWAITRDVCMRCGRLMVDEVCRPTACKDARHHG